MKIVTQTINVSTFKYLYYHFSVRNIRSRFMATTRATEKNRLYEYFGYKRDHIRPFGEERAPSVDAYFHSHIMRMYIYSNFTDILFHFPQLARCCFSCSKFYHMFVAYSMCILVHKIRPKQPHFYWAISNCKLHTHHPCFNIPRTFYHMEYCIELVQMKISMMIIIMHTFMSPIWLNRQQQGSLMAHG